jgi:mevalonate kinase
MNGEMERSPDRPSAPWPLRTVASAPGKIILFGEHAVVYGQPAIAAPVWQTQATAEIMAGVEGGGCLLSAPDIAVTRRLVDCDEAEPLALVVRRALADAGAPADPDWMITVRSTIPIASGLGSGAALSTALVRAVWLHCGFTPEPARVSALVFESERYYHGTPSGIDNTVIAWGLPVWFVRGRPPEIFHPGASFTIVIGDTGVRSPTAVSVGDVRSGWQADPVRFEALFAAVGQIARRARQLLEAGNPEAAGPLMTENQQLLAALGVSSLELEHLIAAAMAAGAWGAKLSGGGRGGNMIALAPPARAGAICAALHAAGAVHTWVTEISDQLPASA